MGRSPSLFDPGNLVQWRAKTRDRGQQNCITNGFGGAMGRRERRTLSNCSSLTHQRLIAVAVGEDDVEETVLCQKLKGTDSKGRIKFTWADARARNQLLFASHGRVTAWPFPLEEITRDTVEALLSHTPRLQLQAMGYHVVWVVRLLLKID
jgi:hypothetical protein